MENLDLSKITLEFVQEGNTLGTTDEMEHLEVTLESPLFFKEEGYFYVLKTKTGWSIDKPEELLEIIRKCKEVGDKFVNQKEEQDV